MRLGGYRALRQLTESKIRPKTAPDAGGRCPLTHRSGALQCVSALDAPRAVPADKSITGGAARRKIAGRALAGEER